MQHITPDSIRFKSDDKKINQYMLHAVAVAVYRDGRLVEFIRHIDSGYAVINDGRVVEIFVRSHIELERFKKSRDIDAIIDELNEEWLINKI